MHARTKLQNAADAGVLAAAQIIQEGGTKLDAEKAAAKYFGNNNQGSNFANGIKPEISISQNEVTMLVAGQVPTTLMKVAGIEFIPVAATASSRLVSPQIDVHILVDVSGSMNIPDSPAEIARFSALFKPYGGGTNCSFACHVPGDPVNGEPGTFNGQTGFQIARANDVYLREDRVRDSLVAMIDDLSRSQNASSIQLALYKFEWGPVTQMELANDFAQAIKAARLIENNSGGTQGANTLRLLGAALDEAGSDHKRIVVLITDGVDQDMDTGGPGRLDVAACSELKAKGVDIMVLNMDYPDPDDLEGSPEKIAEFTPSIEAAPPLLESCATPGMSFKARGGSEISSAMDQIGSVIAKHRVVALAK